MRPQDRQGHHNGCATSLKESGGILRELEQTACAMAGAGPLLCVPHRRIPRGGVGRMSPATAGGIGDAAVRKVAGWPSCPSFQRSRTRDNREIDQHCTHLSASLAW